MQKWQRDGIWLALVLMLVAIASPLHAGAWLQKRGSYYFKLSGNYIFTTTEFNHLGERLDIFQERVAFENASFRDFSVFAYAEYGLLETLTLVGTLPFKYMRTAHTELAGGGLVPIDVVTETAGLADLTIEGRVPLLLSPLTISAQGGIKIPLGYDSTPDNDGAPLGTGETDGILRVLAGKSLWPVPAYITAGAGYRWRGGPLQDEWLWQAEVGYTAGPFLLKVYVDGVRNSVRPIPDITGQPVVTPLPGGGGATPNVIVGDQDFLKISPSIIYNMGNGLSLQGEILHIAAGKNTIAGTIYSLGVIFSN